MTKSLSRLILLITSFTFLSLTAVGQSGKKLISDVKVSTDYLDTPSIAVAGLKDDSKKQNWTGARWLVINVEFTTGTKGVKSPRPEWLDDLRIDAVALIPSYYDGKEVSALLFGTQRLWSVPIDGGKHRARLLVPPVVLARYYKGSEKLSKAYKEIPVMVKLKTKDQREIGVGTYSAKRIQENETIKIFEKTMQSLNILKIQKSIFPVEKTPWAFVEYDHLDMPQTPEGMAQ